jgi:lambda repressor-like predicted transcriptional regulator
MENKPKDVRDEILDHLKEIERPLSWLSLKSGINYSTIYSVLRQRTFNFSEENMAKINNVLGTNF